MTLIPATLPVSEPNPPSPSRRPSARATADAAAAAPPRPRSAARRAVRRRVVVKDDAPARAARRQPVLRRLIARRGRAGGDRHPWSVRLPLGERPCPGAAPPPQPDFVPPARQHAPGEVPVVSDMETNVADITTKILHESPLSVWRVLRSPMLPCAAAGARRVRRTRRSPCMHARRPTSGAPWGGILGAWKQEQSQTSRPCCAARAAQQGEQEAARAAAALVAHGGDRDVKLATAILAVAQLAVAVAAAPPDPALRRTAALAALAQRQAARGHDATAAAAARGAFSAAFAPFEAVAEALARLGDDAAPEAVAEAQRRRRRSCDVAAAVTAMRL